MRGLSERAEELIELTGGTNPYGQPNFRVVLGLERDHEPSDCWHLERWLPPEQYGDPVNWNAAELGPFPSQGDYEHCYALEGPHGERLHPEFNLSWVLDLIRLLRRSKERVLSDPGAAKRALLEREERATERWTKRNLDMLDDLRPAFNAYDFVAKP